VKNNPLLNNSINSVLPRLDETKININEKLDAITDTFDDKLVKLRANLKKVLKAELFPDIQRHTRDQYLEILLH
jgi:hypothetical protein